MMYKKVTEKDYDIHFYVLISHLGITSFEEKFILLYHSRIGHGFKWCPQIHA